MSKKYGLLSKEGYAASKKPQIPAPAVKKNVFGDSSSDDDNRPIKKPKISGISMTQKRLAQQMQNDALAEDPTIFQYDEVYEEIDNKRKEELQSKKSTEAKKPKYINRLLEAADKRKIENERRVERKVQKEREAEGEEFKDKEQFVTSSYKKKLEEMKKIDEEEEREARIESLTDVTKQKDLSGFYRHIFKQTTDEQGEPSKTTEDKKKNYRKRKSSDDEDENEDQKKEVAHLPCNLDADSDFSIDSSDSEDEKQMKKPEEIKVEKVDDETSKTEPISTSAEVKDEKIESEIKIEEPPKPKIDIWKKRTVGEVFDQAVLRYYERKSLKAG